MWVGEGRLAGNVGIVAGSSMEDWERWGFRQDENGQGEGDENLMKGHNLDSNLATPDNGFDQLRKSWEELTKGLYQILDYLCLD